MGSNLDPGEIFYFLTLSYSVSIVLFLDTEQVPLIPGGGLVQAFGFWAFWSCMVKAILALSLWLVAQVSSCVLVASVPSFLLTIVLLCFLYIFTDTEQVLPFTGGGLFPSLWIPGSLVLHCQSVLALSLWCNPVPVAWWLLFCLFF